MDHSNVASPLKFSDTLSHFLKVRLEPESQLTNVCVSQALTFYEIVWRFPLSAFATSRKADCRDCEDCGGSRYYVHDLHKLSHFSAVGCFANFG